MLLERTEARHRDRVTLLHGGDDGVEQRVQNAACFGLGQGVLVSQTLDEVSLVHE